MNIPVISATILKNDRIFSATPIQNLRLADVLCSDEVSFTGAEKTLPIILDGAKEFSGIHCPGCGKRMISVKDFHKLIERAGNIQSTTELVDLLNEYRRFLPKPMKKILLSKNQKDKEFNSMTVSEFYIDRKQKANQRKTNKITKAKRFLFEFAATSAPDRQKLITQTLETLDHNEPFKSYKEKVIKLLNTLGLSLEEKNELSLKTLREVSGASYDCGIFSLEDLDSKTPQEIATHLVKNVFKNSIGSIHNIDRNEMYKEHPLNKLLLCSSCTSKRSKYFFWNNGTDPELKHTIFKYMGDIAKLMGDDKVPTNPAYFKYFAFISDVHSQHRIKYSPEEMEQIRQVRLIASRHERFTPIEQTHTDIPCADCGSIMLPHDIRIVIEDEMKYCSSLKDYAKILTKYQKYVGEHSQKAANIFLGIIKEKDNISKKDFLKRFRSRLERYCDREVSKIIGKYKRTGQYYKENHSAEDFELHKLIGDRVEKYYKAGRFKTDNYTYHTMLEYCCQDVDLSRCPLKAVFVLFDELKEICYRHGIGLSLPMDAKDKDEIYSILFKIFKTDVATADHLVAHSKGGGGERDNIIALCHGCNKNKNKKDVNAWFGERTKVRYNLPRQMRIIDKMAKEGKIEGYEHWAENIKKKMSELTNGKFDEYADI